MATYDTHSIVWPIHTVNMPRSGHPVASCSATNSSSSEMPWITSGMTSGALIMAVKVVEPRNRR